MMSLAQNMWWWTRVDFPLRHLAKEHLQLARKVTFFCEIDKGPWDYLTAGWSFLREHSARFCRTAEVNVTSKLVKLAEIKTSLPTWKIWQPFEAEGDQCGHLGTWKISSKYAKSVLDVWLGVRHDPRTTPATSIFQWFLLHDPNKLRSSFLESPETFRAHLGWHNSLCIFKTKASRGMRLWSYFHF